MEPPWRIPGLSRVHVLNFLGDALYPKIRALEPTRAGPITGMLLHGLTTSELETCIADPTVLGRWVTQAHRTLAAYKNKTG